MIVFRYHPVARLRFGLLVALLVFQFNGIRASSRHHRNLKLDAKIHSAEPVHHRDIYAHLKSKLERLEKLDSSSLARDHVQHKKDEQLQEIARLEAELDEKLREVGIRSGSLEGPKSPEADTPQTMHSEVPETQAAPISTGANPEEKVVARKDEKEEGEKIKEEKEKEESKEAKDEALHSETSPSEALPDKAAGLDGHDNREEHKEERREERREEGIHKREAPHHKEKHAKKELAIYIYDLPANLTNCTQLIPFFADFAAEVRVPLWLKDMGYTVKDPEAADLFYVPLYHYCAAHNVHDNPVKDRYREEDLSRLVREALAHVQKMDFWFRYNGADHIWTFTAPHGFCGIKGYGEMHVPEIQESIMLVHWGHEQPEYYCKFQDRVLAGGVCTDERSMKGEALPRLPCFVPEKDIVIANMAFENFDPVAPYDMQLSDRLSEPHAPRKFNVFFGGRANMEDPYYSHGVRQTLFMLFRNLTEFRLIQTDRRPGIDCTGQACDRQPEEENPMQFRKGFEEAIFCVVATGLGWSQRAKMAVLHGCIPIVFADNVQMEYEDVLPWNEFAVRLPQYMMYRLPEGLDILFKDPDRLKQMQQRTACVSKYFTWQEPHGKAGEALICSLLRRLHGPTKVIPHMDWDLCQLVCEVHPEA